MNFSTFVYGENRAGPLGGLGREPQRAALCGNAVSTQEQKHCSASNSLDARRPADVSAGSLLPKEMNCLERK
jgi:hypothetical protein